MGVGAREDVTRGSGIVEIPKSRHLQNTVQAQTRGYADFIYPSRTNVTAPTSSNTNESVFVIT